MLCVHDKTSWTPRKTGLTPRSSKNQSGGSEFHQISSHHCLIQLFLNCIPSSVFYYSLILLPSIVGIVDIQMPEFPVCAFEHARLLVNIHNAIHRIHCPSPSHRNEHHSYILYFFENHDLGLMLNVYYFTHLNTSMRGWHKDEIQTWTTIAVPVSFNYFIKHTSIDRRPAVTI